MGNYTASEFMDLFGGLPERGDCAPDPDAIREHSPHHLGASLKRFQRTGMACDNCGADVDERCQPWCRAEQIS